MSLVRRHPLVAFYILAFLISWLGYVPAALYSHGLFPFQSPLFAVLGSGGPAIAAMIVAWVLGRGKGLRGLLAPLLRWRVSVGWYLVALLLQPVLFALAALLGVLFGSTTPDWSKVAPPFVPVIMLISYVVVNVWEEIGWRGFALPRLQAKRSALVSSLVVGLLWCLWHAPLFFLADNPMAQMPLFYWFVGNLAATVAYTWVYNGARGSLLLVTLLHAAENTAAAVLYMILGGFPAVVVVVDAALKCLLAIVLVLVYRPAHLARGERVMTVD